MPDNQTLEEDHHQRKLLLDWYNHLTTSSLVILGGIFGFLPPGKPPSYVIYALFLVVTGGALALAAASRTVLGQMYKGSGFIGRRLEGYAHMFIAIGALIFVVGRIS